MALCSALHRSFPFKLEIHQNVLPRLSSCGNRSNNESRTIINSFCGDWLFLFETLGWKHSWSLTLFKVYMLNLQTCFHSGLMCGRKLCRIQTICCTFGHPVAAGMCNYSLDELKMWLVWLRESIGGSNTLVLTDISQQLWDRLPRKPDHPNFSQAPPWGRPSRCWVQYFYRSQMDYYAVNKLSFPSAYLCCAIIIIISMFFGLNWIPSKHVKSNLSLIWRQTSLSAPIETLFSPYKLWRKFLPFRQYFYTGLCRFWFPN